MVAGGGRAGHQHISLSEWPFPGQHAGGVTALSGFSAAALQICWRDHVAGARRVGIGEVVFYRPGNGHMLYTCFESARSPGLEQNGAGQPDGIGAVSTRRRTIINAILPEEGVRPAVYWIPALNVEGFNTPKWAYKQQLRSLSICFLLGYRRRD